MLYSGYPSSGKYPGSARPKSINKTLRMFGVGGDMLN